MLWMHWKARSGHTAVHVAAANDHSILVTYLLEGGGFPCSRDHDGNTPLHLAAWNNADNAIDVLLEDPRSDVNQNNKVYRYGKHLQYIS